MRMRLQTHVSLLIVLAAGCPGDDTTNADSGSTSDASTGTTTMNATSTTAGTGVMTSSSGADSSTGDPTTGETSSATSTTSGSDSGSSGSTGEGESSSSGAGIVCGNGVAEPGEDCDEDDLAGETCETQGFSGGDISCSPACTLNLSLCANATLDLGDENCTLDAECTTGVCWDFADYDPFCGGSVCSSNCVNDQQCQNVFAAAGAPFPQNVACGPDGRCDPIGSGFGAFFCASAD